MRLRHLFWIWVLVTALLPGCQQRELPPYYRVTISYPEHLENASRFLYYLNARPDSGQSRTILAKNDDILALRDSNDFVYFSYTPALGDSLHSRFVDGRFYLNGVLTGLALDTSYNLLPWLTRMTEQEIKQLQSLQCNSTFTDAYLPYLEKISKKAPGLNLFLEMDWENPATAKQVDWLAAHFRPRVLYLDCPGKEMSRLSAFQGIHQLILSIEGSEPIANLPAMPFLEQLQISGEHLQENISPSFFIQLPELERLTIGGKLDFTAINWSALRYLKSLQLVDPECSKNTEFGKLFPGISEFFWIGTDTISLQQISGFQHLQELGLPRETPQAVFDAVIRSQPKLSLLFLGGHSSTDLTDFSILQTEKYLTHLVISNDQDSVLSIPPIKSLQFLSIPFKAYADSIQLKQLQQDNPKALITPNDGFCMGSGWILLLLPLAMLFIQIYARGRETKIPEG